MSQEQDTELAQACNLLAAEFPDTARSVLEGALRESDLDIPSARRKLLELQADQRGQQGASTASAAATSPSSAQSPSGISSWFSSQGWNQGMRDLGLESLGAQLSYYSKQVANTLNSILPADLSLFGDEEDEYEEEAMARAAAEEGKDEARVAVATGRANNRVRSVGLGGGSLSPRSGAGLRHGGGEQAEDEEWEDDHGKHD